MKFKRLIYRTILGATTLFLTFTTCTSHNELPVPEPEQEEHGMPIRWTVIPEGMQDGRALINSTTNLQTACSTGGQSIGIWSAYELGADYQEDILGNENGDVSLIYQSTPIWENWQGWTYGEKAASWKQGAIHYFNAYFPMTGGLTGVKNTKTSIKGNYNAETTQTDIMVTKVVVNTAVNFQGSPIELPMKHTLATLQFKFQMEEGSTTDYILQSFSLDKTLRTSADLNYEGGDITIDHWINKTASSNTRIYAQTLNPGLSFSATTAVNPYQGNANDGHILIIPQSCTTAPTFDCTIGVNATESLPFQNISLGTTLFEPGKNYIYTIKVNATMLDVELSIKDWNELDSSYNIDF